MADKEEILQTIYEIKELFEKLQVMIIEDVKVKMIKAEWICPGCHNSVLSEYWNYKEMKCTACAGFE